MKVKFKGAPGEDLKSITMYGTEFATGKSVDVSKLPHNVQRKLANHPHFEASGRDVEDAQFAEVAYDSQRDGALQAVNLQAEHDIAIAELQGKQPAPNAKEGLVEDVAEGPAVKDVSPAAQAAEREAAAKAEKEAIEAAQKVETKEYADGTKVTGPGPLPQMSPAEQDAADVRSALIAKAIKAGVKVDGRWSDERIEKAIAEAKGKK